MELGLTSKSYWHRWKSGIRRPEMLIAISCLFLGWMTSSFVSPMDGTVFLYLIAICYVGLVVVAIMVSLPIIITNLPPTPEALEKLAREMTPAVDSTLASLAIDWNKSPLIEIETQIEGQRSRATKNLHDIVGIKWDDVGAAIYYWPITVVKAKIDAIEKAVTNREALVSG